MYKYIYGTARWLCDNSATSTTELEYGSMVLSELGVPTYYNVPQWSANAVYCDGIGKSKMSLTESIQYLFFKWGKNGKIRSFTSCI